MYEVTMGTIKAKERIMDRLKVKDCKRTAQ